MLRKTVKLIMSMLVAVVLTACNGSDSSDKPFSPLNSPLVPTRGPKLLEKVSARLDNPFQLQPGQTASLEAQKLSVEFVEVVEDSRCPRGVLCTWAGQALILVRVSGSSGDQELTLQLGPRDSVAGVYDGYLFELTALEPYPQAPGKDSPPQPPYTATLLVSQ